MTQEIPEQIRGYVELGKIFMPRASEQSDALFQSRAHATFVHYTSAQAALQIIRTKRLWMRNTLCMSDYREVQHGYDIYQSYFHNKNKRTLFFDALDSCAPGAAVSAIELFDKAWKRVARHTYITAVSEHSDFENNHGRLSMWRAFGGREARVGIVVRIPQYSPAALALNLIFSPVAYLGEPGAHAVLDQVIENIYANRQYLTQRGTDLVRTTVFTMLLAGVACLKHEGFREEQEWRVIHFPTLASSSLVEHSVETFNGVPQVIYKIPLENDLDLGVILDRLIIGPTQFAFPMTEAFVLALSAAGVQEPEKRIIASGIPIRT
jgi:DUF2971 family protein